MLVRSLDVIDYIFSVTPAAMGPHDTFGHVERSFDAIRPAVDRCGRAGQWEVALALLHDTRKRGPPPTASVYIATAQACARAGKWEEATELKEVSLLCRSSPSSGCNCVAPLIIISPSHIIMMGV